MLTVDGQPITTLPTNHPAVVELRDLMGKLDRDYADAPIIIKTNRKRVEYENGYIEQPNTVYLPTETYYTPKTSLSPMVWRYYQNPSDARNPMAAKRFAFDSETLYITKENRDLAVFLMFMLKYENGTPFYGSEYEVFSTKKADSRIADNYRTQANLTFYIFGENDIAKDIKRLIRIGRSLGMAEFKYDEKFMNEDTVRNRLFEYIMEGEQLGQPNRNIEAFLNAISSYVETDLRSFVQECFDEGILELKDNNEVYIIEGKKEDFLLRISDINTGEYISDISNHLKNDQVQRNRLEQILGHTAYNGGSYEWEDIKAASPRLLDSIMREFKIKFKGTPEEKRNKICEVLGIQPGA